VSQPIVPPERHVQPRLNVTPLAETLTFPPKDTSPDDLASAAWPYRLQQTAPGLCDLDEIIRTGGGHHRDEYGTAVAVGCDLLVVGAPHVRVGGSGTGAAYVFARNQGGPEQWDLVKRLTADDPNRSVAFGYSVAVDCDTIVVGDPLVGTRERRGIGAAYVYERNYDPDHPDLPSPDNWGLVRVLMDPEWAAWSTFGRSVDIACNTAIVGAPGADLPGQPGAGVAFVYGRDVDRDDPSAIRPNDWGLINILQAADAHRSDRFGSSVALSCATAVVGAPHKDVDDQLWRGAVYVFDRNYDPDHPDTPAADHWGQRKKLTLSSGRPAESFGASVDLSGDTLVVGAPDRDVAFLDWAGSAFVFRRDYDPANPGTPAPDNWGQLKTLTGSAPQAGASFGQSVAIDGERVVVGAPNRTVSNLGDAGAVLVFERNHNPDDPSAPAADYWGQRQMLLASVLNKGATFGASVSADGARVAVGAPQEGSYDAETGAAYLFGCAAAQLPATLEIDQWHSPEPITAAWDFHCFIDITNTAAVSATRLLVTETLSSWVAAYSVQPGQGGSSDGAQTVTWSIKSLRPGETVRLSIKARTYSTAAGHCMVNHADAVARNAGLVSTDDEACIVAGALAKPTATPTPAPTPTPVGTTMVIKKDGPGNSLDTYIYRNQPYSNYWLDPLLKVGYKQSNASLIQFDLSPIPAGAQVEEAWLEVFAAGWSGPGADIVIGAYAVSNTVQISQTTWVSPELGLTWGLGGANDLVVDRRPLPESLVTTKGPLAWYRFDLKHLTQQWLDGQTANNGVMLRCEGCYDQTHPSEPWVAWRRDLCTRSFFFASGEYSDQTRWPRLVVRYH